MSALDEGSVEIHREVERLVDALDPRSTSGRRPLRHRPIVSAGSSSSAFRRSSAFPRENEREDGTMDEDEVRASAETELGRSLQDIQRIIYEAQAEIETVRLAVGALVESFDRHVIEHERRDRSRWFERFGSWLGDPTNDRHPW